MAKQTQLANGVNTKGGSVVSEFDNLATQLRTTLSTLEKRVEGRAHDLEVLAEVSRRIAAVLDPHELLPYLVNLTRDSFDLYHCHIYLLDERQENLVLAAGAGEVGPQMVANGHSISIANPHSIVAKVARQREDLISNNVLQDPDHLPNALLPLTRSEMALPLMISGRLLGVFDMQSDQADYFDDEDRHIKGLLAGQISIALENARAFDETRRFSRENESFRFALDQSTIIAVTDVTGKILFVNDKFCEISKYSREELVGQDHRIINSGHHDKAFIRDLWVTIANGRVWKGEIKNKAKDGSYYWVDTTLVPFLNEEGKPYQYMALRHDITERKENELEIARRSSELESFRFALDQSTIVAITDVSGKILFVNDKFCEISKYSREELIGQDHRLINSGHHDKEFIRDLWVTIANGQVWKGEIKNKAKDGSYYWVDTTLVPFLNERGKPFQYMALRYDITERKQNEMEIEKRSSELESFRFALDQSTIVAITDVTGKITFVNDKFCEISKYSREELIGQDHRLINSGHHDKEFIRDLWVTIANGRVWKGEIKNKAKDGSYYWVDTTLVPFLNEQGKPYQYMALRYDITERKQNELNIFRRSLELETAAKVATAAASIRDTNQLLEEVALMIRDSFDLYHAHFYLLESDTLVMTGGAGEAGRVMKMNSHSIPLNHEHSIVALTARTGVAQNIADVTLSPDFLPNPLLPETRSELALPLLINNQLIGVLDVQSAIAGRFTDEDIRISMTVADQISVAVENAQLFEASQQALDEVSKRSVELETVAAVSMAAASILNAEELLKQVSDLTRDSFNLYHAHIYLVDEETEQLVLAAGAGEAGRVMKANRHSIPLFREQSIVAQAAREFAPQVINDVRADPHFLPNALLPETRAEMAIPMILGDSLIGVLDVQSEYVDRFIDEDVRVMTTLAGQITVAVENARVYQEQLAATERLREVDRLKSEFLASMSHELRTPLNSIIGYSEVLLDGSDGELTEEAVEDVEAIYGSGKHLLSIINEILDLAKIEARQMRLDRQAVDLREVIDEILRNADILVKDRPVELRLEIESIVPPVYADPVRLRQIIWNMVSNAVKFTEKGSVTVVISHRNANQALVKVIDTGIGIKREHQGLVFEQFRQVDGSSTRRSGGTGLGLAITRQLVTMHDGQIGLDSEYGEGSTFWFSMPLYDAVLGQPNLQANARA